MIKLLAKIFIKDSQNTADSKVRVAYGYLCGAVGIALNILLFAGKIIAGTISGSVAVTADAFNNLSDAGSSIISLIGFRLASQKPDPHHPFGHGRFEYIASLIISIIIVLMGFELGKSSFEKIVAPQAVEYSAVTFAVLGVSVLVKLYMFFYNNSVGKKIDSATMRATAMDSISDAVSTGAVLISAVIAMFTNLALDGWMGLVVAVFIMVTGFKSAKETIDSLLGTPPSPEFVKQIEDMALQYDDIIGVHDMIVHNYGPGRTFVSLHAEVPSDGDIVAIHDTVDNAEREIAKELGCLVTIHMDPVDVHDEHTAQLREKVSEIIKQINPDITFHDFRVVSGPTHTNLIFDIVSPMDCGLSDQELADTIADKIHQCNESYFAVINVDKDFASYQATKK
ncbi:MAG: cation diffusion facilitator family transporter [Oscillospiraceae bacterium]|nr:cation diffusion facilitator family transporter [Oscillospiraceae bacterium]